MRTPPRALLRALPGVELVDLPDSDWCCGSAGVYNLTHPLMADRQLEHKAGHLMLHQTPGLGFGFDEAAVARYAGGASAWTTVGP